MDLHPRIIVEVFSGDEYLKHAFDSEEAIQNFLKLVRLEGGIADRICELEVDFVDDTLFTRSMGSQLIEVFPKLQNLESLTLEGCLDHQFGLLDSPPHFPRLTSLTCDFPLEANLEHFFEMNPTIESLVFEGSHNHPSALREGVLPNLEFVQCDMSLLGYFAPHRPLQRISPTTWDHTVLGIEQELDPLKRSTAVGGVKTFCLQSGYPLGRLVKHTPNLERLHLVEGKNDDNDTYHRFWDAPTWEHGLASFGSLQEIQVRTAGAISHDEQHSLLSRWWKVRPSLTRVTFVMLESVSVGGLPLPELVYDSDGAQDENMDQDVDEKHLHKGREYMEEIVDVAEDSNSESSDDGYKEFEYTRWDWDYEVKRWKSTTNAQKRRT